MVPMKSRPFLVNVNLSRDSVCPPEIVLVSEDIYNDAIDINKHRYIAMSSRTSQYWDLYEVRSSTEAIASSVWLHSSIYKKFCGQQVYVRIARPVILSSVLISFPATTYHLVKDDSYDLRSFSSSGHIFRTAESIELNGYRGKVTLCEPVRQGIISADTEVVLAKEQPIEHHFNPYGGTSSEVDDDDDDYSDMIFSSLLSNSQSGSASVLLNGLARSAVDDKAQDLKHINCLPLTESIPPELIEPSVRHMSDDNYRIFAPIDLLVELACFSGDRVSICPALAKQEAARTVEIYTLPTHFSAQADTIYLPPILFHNLLSSRGLILGDQAITIQRIERLQERPLAKSVTLSRVPSPALTDRALANAFFAALKVHFETARRIVRAGDLILLGIDETLARAFASGDDDVEAIAEFTESSSARMDTFGWFQVMDVEIEQDATWAGDAQVDASSTRMVQSGSEKARIPPFPQWAHYYGLPRAVQHVTNQDANNAYTRLLNLVKATFSPTARKARASATIMLHGSRGCGKRTVASSVAGDLGMHFLEVNCYDIIGETDVKTEAYLRLRFEKAGQCAPCLLLLRNIDALAKKKDDMENGQESAMRFILADCLSSVTLEAGEDFPVAIVATTADKEKIPEGVLGCFRHEVEIAAPDESARLAILETLVHDLSLAPDVSIQSLAVRSAALVASDLVNVVRRAQNFAQDRLDDLAASSTDFDTTDLQIAGGWVTAGDFDQATNEARRNYSDSIGAPKIPNVTWDDVGGLASVKDDIMDTIQLPLERPELFTSGMKKRSGILFYGPPGTGKTLLAKAVATSFSLNFFSVKGPELLNMYIGESEANVRRVFQRARDAKPCVVFFDELDSVAPKRGNQGDSGGVMDRIVSQLLSELDGMAEGKDGSGGVFVIGATNRPDLLDPALLRPGRFDKMLYLGVSDTDEAQYNILAALTRKFRLEPSLDLRSIAEVCPFTYTGADFYALCSDAMLKAMTRQAGLVDAKVKALDPPRTTQYFFDHLATKQDVEVVVSEVDFKQALQELIPSVSQMELEHYKKVQAQFSPKKKEEDSKTADMIKGKGKGKVIDSKANGVVGHFKQDIDEDGDLYA